jgi:hypothetical protein
MMSERKVVSRSIAIALVIVCVILAAAIAAVIANYTTIINDKDSTLSSKDSQIQTLTNQKNQLESFVQGNVTYYTSQITSLQSQIQTLTNEKGQLQNQISSLNSQITSLQVPKLMGIIYADDNRPFLQTPYLHVYGYVYNVGVYTAYNSKVHVVLRQSGGVIAKDTSIVIGIIFGEEWAKIDSNIYYDGSALINWSITLEWTS